MPKYFLIWVGCFHNPKKQPHSQQLSAGRKNNFLIKFTLFAVSQLTRMIEIVFGGEMPLKKLLISWAAEAIPSGQDNHNDNIAG